MFKHGILAAVFCIGLLPAMSGAALITLDGHQYDVSLFNTASNLVNFREYSSTADDQPWWGSRDLALSAADQIGMQLGLPNLGETEGPFFAYDYFIFDTFVEVAVYALFSDGSFRTSWVVASTDFAGVWAVAEKVAVPLPAPVALLLAGLAGIGYSRKRFSQVERV